MKRIVAFALLLACSAAPAISQSRDSDGGPLVSFFLPQRLSSQKVQIRYFISEAFGGYGSFLESQPDHDTVDFIAAVDGKPADHVTGFAYLPGCEIVKFEFAVAGTAAWKQLDCKPLKTITLRGHIPADALKQAKRPVIDVSYDPDWARRFFGIADGTVPSISLSQVIPSENGDFAVEVPDFQSQEDYRPAGQTFILREAESWNILSFLVPENALHIGDSLTVNRSYPELISFTARGR